jgi:3-phenylpropionate/cinnamic acid dioxygenase small subunit
LYRYAELIDAGDFAGVGELFAHGEITADGMTAARGAADVAALFTSTTRRYDDGTPRTAHVITNPIVEIDGDQAEVRSRFTVLQHKPAGGTLEPIIAGGYRDRFERVDGRWQFASREMQPRLFGDLGEHLLFDAGRIEGHPG